MAQRARIRPAAGTLLSTAAIALAFPPVEWSALIWVGLVPFFFALKRCRSASEALIQGFWLNFLLGFASVFWIATAVPRYLGASISVGIAALVVHACVHQFQFLVFAGVHWWKSRGAAPASLLGLLCVASLYTGIDWATPKVFQDTIGIALHEFSTLRQLAAFGGAPLLTFTVLVANVGFFVLLEGGPDPVDGGDDRRSTRIRRAAWVAAPLACLYAIAALENSRIDRAIEVPERSIVVGFVQGNIDGELKKRWSTGDADAAREALDIYLGATHRLVESGARPDFIVWPETTYPGVFRKPESDAQLLLNVSFDRAIAALGIPLVFGAYDREDRTDRRVLRNALYFVEPEVHQSARALSPMQVYHKSILLPLGEYFPLVEEDTIRKWFPRSAHFSRGQGARVYALELPDGHRVRVGPSICYEDLFPDYTAEIANAGAELLINISNDSWLGDTGAARFHLIFAKLRSIETRRSQLRVTNSGYSGLILPNGKMRNETIFDVEAADTMSIPLLEVAPTLRMRWGDWFGPLCLVVGLLSLLLRRR